MQHYDKYLENNTIQAFQNTCPITYLSSSELFKSQKTKPINI